MENLVPSDAAQLEMVFKARQWRFIEKSEERCSVVADSILRGDLRGHMRSGFILDVFAGALQPMRYIGHRRASGETPLLQAWSSEGSPSTLDVSSYRAGSNVLDRCARVIQLVASLGGRTVGEWSTRTEPWDELVEGCRAVWGDRWQFYALAGIAAGLEPPTLWAGNPVELLDGSKSLCQRLSYARLRAGASLWWDGQIRGARGPADEDFLLLAALSWASGGTIQKLAPMLSRRVNGLAQDRWQKLAASVKQIVNLSWSARRRIGTFDLQLGTRSPRLLTLLALRSMPAQKKAIFEEHLSHYGGKDRVVLQWCTDYLNRVIAEQPFWRPSRSEVALISRGYSVGVGESPHMYQRYALGGPPMDANLASEITGDAANHPRSILGMAESTMRQITAGSIVPISDVAQTEGWFSSHGSRR